MHVPLPLLGLCWLPLWLGVAAADTGDHPGGPRNAPLPSVVVVRSGHVAAFQEVAEAFQDGCRVHVQQLQLGDGGVLAVQRERLTAARVLVAVGQPAAEALAGMRAHIVYALVPDPPAGAIGSNSTAPPQDVLQALQRLKPDVKRVGVVYTQRVVTRMPAARQAAKALGLELVERPVSSGPEAISVINGLVSSTPPQPGADGSGPVARGPLIDALWLGPDPLLIDSPVTYFLIQAQLMSRVPVIASTRQLVSHGALLAVDWSPESVGRHLAWQVNHLLDDPDHLEGVAREHPITPPEAVVNVLAARRLGISLNAVRGRPGWKFIE